ncbi:MAG TPA: histidine kinase [Thermoclostridium sp.]|nr:histidine kinase [Thermoclostridium sp.]
MKPLIKTIKGRIIISTLLFSFALSIFIAVISYRVYHNYLRNNLIQSSELSLQVIGDTINTDLKNAYSLAQWCQTNNTIGEFSLYGTKSSTQKLKVYDDLNEHYNSNNSSEYIQRVLVASNLKQFVQVVLISHSSSIDVFEVVDDLEYFDTALKSHDYYFDMGFVYDPFRIKSKLSVLPLIRPIHSLYDSNVTGWIFISISPNLFSDAINTYYHSSDEAIYLTLANNTYLYKDGTFVPVDYADDFFIQDDNSKFTTLYDNTVISTEQEGGTYLVTRPLVSPNCYLTKEININELVSQTNFFILILLIISLVIVLAGFFMSLLLNKVVNTPITKMQDTMTKISGGDFSRDVSIEWDNEFGDIGRGINQLSANIQNLMASRLEMEKQKRDYEYQMLQNQINPHFLYNTLASIKWMATVQNAPGIAEMTTALSRLLKDISKGENRFIALSEELSLLMDYYTIMKYRYGGTIRVEIKTDDEQLLGCQIIKFTLQPIVENAIFHGIEPKGSSGTISIHVFKNESSDLQVDITDDGVGMDENMIQSLLSERYDKSKTTFFKRIGIANVHNRIRLEYGSKYGISIRSKLGSFTTVTILLPYIQTSTFTDKSNDMRKD